MVVRTQATRPVGGCSRSEKRRGWKIARKAATCLLLGACGAAAMNAPLVATPVVSFPAYTSPTEMDGTNSQLITLTMSTASAPSTTDTFNTLAFDAVLNWTVSGTTWSGNPITPDLLALSTWVVTGVGDLYTPLNTPSALSATVVNNSTPSAGEANFVILSNGDLNVGVPYQTSSIGTVNFTVAADVRAATFSLGFSSNPNFSFFTEPTTFTDVPFLNGGGSITVVPEPAGFVTLAALMAGSGGLAFSAWRTRRRAAGRAVG